MSVQPRPWPQPTLEIVAAARSMYQGKRERPLPVVVRDRLGEWLADEQFAGAYGKRGKPGWPPSRLALVTIFQMAEDLTDRQAAEAVRTRIDWNYALGPRPPARASPLMPRRRPARGFRLVPHYRAVSAAAEWRPWRWR